MTISVNNLFTKKVKKQKIFTKINKLLVCKSDGLWIVLYYRQLSGRGGPC